MKKNSLSTAGVQADTQRGSEPNRKHFQGHVHSEVFRISEKYLLLSVLL